MAFFCKPARRFVTLVQFLLFAFRYNFWDIEAISCPHLWQFVPRNWSFHGFGCGCKPRYRQIPAKTSGKEFSTKRGIGSVQGDEDHAVTIAVANARFAAIL